MDASNVNYYTIYRAAMEWGRQFVHSVITVEPWEVSLLWLLWYVNSAGGVDSIWELEDAAQVNHKDRQNARLLFCGRSLFRL